MKRKFYFILLAVMIIAVWAPNNYTNTEPTEPAEAEETIVENKYEVELAALSRAETRTRDASVKIYSPSGGHGSGAYFLYKNRHVVFTAAHVVDEAGVYIVVDKWGNQRVGAVVYADFDKDFAILLIPEFEKTSPMRLRLPRYNIRKKIDTELIFSGFPGEHSLITIRGRTSGNEGHAIIMHAAAWLGASGSCVFDTSGNFIGIMYGVSVGGFLGAPVLIEDFVWVLPHDQIDWDSVGGALEAIN